jgi:broad specificity phosphatase PhoE
MRIYLVRHGQSEWQLQPSDDWDTPLTPAGHEQARRLAAWLAEQQEDGGDPTRVGVGALCASTSRRAEQTAAYAADALGLPLVTDLGLAEAGFHVAEHLPTLETPVGPVGSSGPTATYTEFKLQAEKALRSLVEQAESAGSLLAVTHAGLIKTLLRIVSGSDSFSFRLCNTGITMIEWRGVRWDLVYLNRWDHLPTELRTF